MLFLSVLLALLVERMVSGWRPQRRHRWFAAYWRRIAAWPAAERLVDSTWGLALLLLPLLLLLALATGVAGTLGGLVELAFATLVLIYSLGPRDLRSDVEAYAEAQDAGDQVAADQRAMLLAGEMPPSEEPDRSVALARGVLGEAGPRLFGPLFWFIVLGPVGAAAYRFVQLLAEAAYDDDEGAVHRHAEELRWLADWLPTRAGLLTYAAAGNFDAVRRSWQKPPDGDEAPSNTGLLGEAGMAALGLRQVANERDMPTTDGDPASGWYVDEAIGLVWRALLVWLAILGVASLVAWID